MSPHYTRLRRCVGHDQLLVPSVAGIILNECREVLLQRRTDFGRWGLPGGAIELGESFLQTLHREVREETGLTVSRAAPFAIYSDAKYRITYPNGDQIQPIHIAFHVQEWSGELACDGEETLVLGFFAMDRLPPDREMHVPQITLIRDFQRYRAEGQLIVD